MTWKGKAWRIAAAAAMVLAAMAVAAPHFRADGFRARIHDSLERALGRKVEIGEVRFSLFPGPGFTVERVVVYDNPSIGIEPLAYANSGSGGLTARLSLWSLLRGRFEFASVKLEDASINLVKTSAGSEPGRWNFESLLNRNFLAAFPEVHILGRINFKFGDTKSVFYLTNVDLNVTPPSRAGRDWKVSFSGEPARTDRPARGFGSLEAAGSWNGRQLDLDLRLDRNAVGEVIALVRGRHAGIHGVVSSRLRFSGPLDSLRIAGNIMLEDIHRWDQMPPHGNEWPLAVSGRLNLPAQVLEVEAHSSSGQTPPIAVRFRASEYLSQPRWGVSMNWNRFPLAPLLELARHMGAEIPARLKVSGTLDGAIGYAGQGSLQGELGFHDTAVTIPDSAPIRFEKARLLFDRGRLHLAPALVRTAQDDQVEIQADYTFDTQHFALAISTESMDVASLRSQVALAAVPWLEQVQSGRWKGQLRYTWRPHAGEDEEQTGWTGRIALDDARIPLPGVAEPLRISSANAQIAGRAVVLDHMRAQVGAIQAQGDYRYDPAAARPHRLRVVFQELDAAELERLLMPALRRASLIARALRLGRVPVPDWLAHRHIDGAVQIGALAIGGARLEQVRGRLLWDGLKVELNGIQARMENGSVTGSLAVNLRGARPSYRLVSQLRAMDCKSGKVDTEAVLETAGTGAELMENLRAEGTFTGRGMELASLPPFKTVSGAYKFAAGRRGPKLQLSDLQLATASEIFTGRGATQDDGRLVVQLTSGNREMRVSGSLAQLKVDEPARVP